MIAVLLPLFKELVDQPDEVRLEIMQGEQTTVFELKVSKEDLGKIIGKKGRTVNSLRQLIHAMSTKHDRRSVLEIVQ